MEHEYWFAVTQSFLCPACKNTSIEKLAVNSPSGDTSLVRAAINRNMEEEEFMCQHCLTRQTRADVLVHVSPSTPQELKAGGYFLRRENNDS